jgi:ABC-type branched-subunit amino acid transport system substrate-binding protein
MNNLIRVYLCIICVICVTGFSFAQAQLTDAERRGKQIYLRGTTASGNEITGRVAEIDLPGSTATCGGCHGMKGEGKTEGGVTAGNLTWPHLLKPYGHTHTTGREHGPFNESSFIRAVVNGVDTNGNELLAAMPRYRLSAQDMADLIAYLKRIDTDLDPGVTDTSIRVGLLVPSQGALADVGAAMKDVFTAYFDNVNKRGGVFNRKIELHVAEVGAGAAAGSVAQDFARKEQIFAFIGGLSAGADAQLAAVARSEQIPFIGPSTLLPHVETPVNRYLFYLLPGVAEQAVSLVTFAASRNELQNASVAIVHNDNTLAVAAATAAEEHAKKIGRRVEAKQVYTSTDFDAKRIVAELKSKDARAVFFFGSGKEQASFLSEAATARWTPHVFILGVMSGKEFSKDILEFKNKIFMALPTVPADVTREGMAEFRALHEQYRFTARNTASQLAAFAAAKIFLEALTRAGKDLSRETLISKLESLYEYDTGLTPRITFGPNRRIGANGAHVIALQDLHGSQD